MTQDPYANAGGYPDPNQPLSPSGYPASGSSANYPQAGYSANPYEGAQQAPQMGGQYPAQPQVPASYPQSPAYPDGQFAMQQGQRVFAAPPKPSPFALLFDFGFRHVATPGLSKLLPIGVLIATGLLYLGAVIERFYYAASFPESVAYQTGGSVFAWLAAVAVALTGWILPLVFTGLTRVFVEMANASIDAAQELKDSADRAV